MLCFFVFFPKKNLVYTSRYMETIKQPVTKEPEPQKKPLADAIERVLDELEERLREKTPVDVLIISGREFKVDSPFKKAYADIQAAALIAHEVLEENRGGEGREAFYNELGATRVDEAFKDFQKAFHSLGAVAEDDPESAGRVTELILRFLKVTREEKDALIGRGSKNPGDKYLIQQTA